MSLANPNRVVPNVKKILVLRANAFGDFLMTLPALDSLRHAYPSAEIVLIGLPWHKAYLERRPSPVDRVEIIPPSRGIRDPKTGHEDRREMESFFESMQAQRFDLALQLHGGGKFSNPFMLRLGAKITAGLRAPDAPPLDLWTPYVLYQNEILRFLETVALVGAAPITLAPRVAVTEADLEESRGVIGDDAAPIVVLQPGAKDPRRRWPAERFAVIADELATLGARIVINGIEAERDACERTARAMKTKSINACGKVSLGGLTGLLARSVMVVSNDSGPMHLAQAVGAGVVSIFWCYNMIGYGPLSTARHRPHVSWRLDCPTCGKICITNDCGHSASLVSDVAVEDVMESSLALYRDLA